MAAWQYTVYLLPKKEVEKQYGVSCDMVEEEFLENFLGWENYPKDRVDELISKGFGVSQTTSYGPIVFGEDDGSCVKLIAKKNILEDVTIRLDLRNTVKVQIETLLKLCDVLDGVFVSPDLAVFDCNKETLIDSIKKSAALKFVKSPEEFLFPGPPDS